MNKEQNKLTLGEHDGPNDEDKSISTAEIYKRVGEINSFLLQLEMAIIELDDENLVVCESDSNNPTMLERVHSLQALTAHVLQINDPAEAGELLRRVEKEAGEVLEFIRTEELPDEPLAIREALGRAAAWANKPEDSPEEGDAR